MAPPIVLLDTSVVVEALVPTLPAHAACNRFFKKLHDAGTTVVYNELLETELCEALFRVALVERWGNQRYRRARYDGRARRRAGRLLDEGLRAWSVIFETLRRSERVNHGDVSAAVPALMRAYGVGSYDAIHVATAGHVGIGDVATLDRGFASVPESMLALHTSRARVASMRQRR